METLHTIRPELLSLSSEDWHALLPHFIVLGGLAVALAVSVMRTVYTKWLGLGLTSVIGLVGAWFSLCATREAPHTLFNGMMVVDPLSSFFGFVFLLAMVAIAVASFRYLDEERLQYPEFNLLLIFSAFGMMMLASSLDLIVLFIALEIMSLAVYTLVGFRRADRRSNEAAMKYFILGSVASAVLLYGSALLYGVAGSTNIREIVAVAGKAGFSPLYVLGSWLVILGFLFKVAAAPFHMWMPDVYEGAPVPVTGFMTTGLKAAAFASFLRVFVILNANAALPELIQKHMHDIFWVVAALTMFLGNLIALTQTNLKRMLAYSSIAHTGYLMIGFLCGKSDAGFAPILFYITSYAIMNLGAFVVLTLLAARADSGLNLHDLSGLSRKHPWLSFAFAVFLLSMAGIPPTAGFFAKYWLFYSAVQAGEVWIVILGVLCSAISVYYYLRVLVHMYMRDPSANPTAKELPMLSRLALVVLTALTLQLGVFPQAIKDIAEKAAKSVQ